MDGQQPDAHGSAIPEHYEIESLDQLRVISDDLRVRILNALGHQPLTVTQLGELLGQAPAKVHYHTRELERAGLVRLVETRERGGILEKYYRAVARNFTVSSTLLRTAPLDDLLAAVREQVDYVTRSFLRSAEAMLQREREASPAEPRPLELGGLSSTQLWVTPEEGQRLSAQIHALLEPYTTPRGIEGERERTWVLLAYGPPPEESEPTIEDQTRTRPRKPRVVIAGAATFDRAQLERAVAQREQLNISVFGGVTFASDVTPELADRAIERFRYRGVLNASPAVREVLKRKERPGRHEHTHED